MKSNLTCPKEYIEEIKLINRLRNSLLSFKRMTEITTQDRIIELLNQYKKVIESNIELINQHKKVIEPNSKSGKYNSGTFSSIINQHQSHGSIQLATPVFKNCLFLLCRRIEEVIVDKIDMDQLNEFSRLVDQLDKCKDRKWKKVIGQDQIESEPNKSEDELKTEDELKADKKRKRIRDEFFLHFDPLNTKTETSPSSTHVFK